MSEQTDPTRDLEQIVLRRAAATQNGANGASEPEQRIQRLYPISFEELDLRPIAPLRYLVAEMLEAAEATMVYAPERHFKSFLMMEWGLSVALGRPFLGRYEAEQGTVLYLDLENNMDRLRERVRGALGRDGLDNTDLGGRFVLQDRGPGLPRWSLDAEAVRELAGYIASHRLDLVVLDNFRAALPPGPSENDNSEINALLRNVIDTCRASGTAFLFAHHTNKGNERYSGANVLATTPANVLRIARDPATGKAIVRADSMRNGGSFDPFEITVEKVGETGVMRLTDANAAVRTTPDYGGLILLALRRGAMSVPELAEHTNQSEYIVRREVTGLKAAGHIVDAGFRAPDHRGGPPTQTYGLPAF